MSIPKTEIQRASLPAELIIDNFVYNIKSSYEEYLTEYVNCSPLFLSLSHGERYIHVPKERQSNKECDCKSSTYQFDFKRMGSQSSLYAKRNLSPQKVVPSNGVLITMLSKQTTGMEVSITNPLLKSYTLEDLERIDVSQDTCFSRDNLSLEYDVKAILNTLKCKKNIMLFHKDYVFTKKEYSFDLVYKTVEEHLNESLSAVLKFRQIKVPDMDTFFAMIIQQYICFGKCLEGRIVFEDFIPLKERKTFLELYEYVGITYKDSLKV